MREQFDISIPQSDGVNRLVMPDGDTDDIVKVILSSFYDCVDDYADFSLHFQADSVRSVCRKVYDYLLANVRYREDALGVQWVRLPARLINDGEGDCKSYSLLTACVLANLGVPFVFRFAAYGKGDVTHVYVVAYDEQGEELPVDCVAKVQRGVDFGHEVPYYRIIDKTIDMTKISVLSGINAYFCEEINAKDNLNVKVLKSYINRCNAEVKGGNASYAEMLNYFRAALDIVNRVNDNDVLRRCGYLLACAAISGELTASNGNVDAIISQAEQGIGETVSGGYGELQALCEFWNKYIVGFSYNVEPKTDKNINDFFMNNLLAVYPIIDMEVTGEFAEQAAQLDIELAKAFGVNTVVIENEIATAAIMADNASIGKTTYGTPGSDLDPYADTYNDPSAYANASDAGKIKDINAKNTADKITAWGNMFKGITDLFSSIGTKIGDWFGGSNGYSANAQRYYNYSAQTAEYRKQTAIIGAVGLGAVALLAFYLFKKR